MTASAETGRAVGLFDERYFLNFEDSDWSVRASAKGHALMVVTDVVIHHRVSASFIGTYSYLGLFYCTRNVLLFGSTVSPRSISHRMRFLRRHVLPVLRQDIRERRGRTAFRHALLIMWAVRAHVRRRYGPATPALEQRATRWGSDDDRRAAE